MIDLTLSDEQLLMRDTARDFARREIAPAVERAEQHHDGHLGREEYLELYRSATKLGLHSLLVPEAYGGAGQGCVDNVIVQEELGAVDVGIGSSLNLTAGVANLIVAGGTEEQRREWLPTFCAADDHVLSGALNEPDVAGSELFCPVPNPELGIRTRAVRDGDDYVITGTKVGWVSNGGVAKAYFVFARTDLDQPAPVSTTAFYVPAASPGLSIGTRAELLGMRAPWHAEVILDEVRVAASQRLGAEGHGVEVMGSASGPMVVGLAAGFVGVARAAYETALAWASERKSWGQPIRQHQAVALMLADMAVDLLAARLVVFDAAASLDRGDVDALALKVPAAKTYAVDVAIANAERAVKIFGGSGVTRGIPAEKFLRDAWTGYSCDFTREVLRLGIAAAL